MKRESMLRDGIVIGVGRYGNRHAMLGGSLGIDGIETNAGASDRPQLRMRLQHAARVGFRAGQGGHHAVQALEQFGLVHLGSFKWINQLETRTFQGFKVGAANAGEWCRADQDFGHIDFQSRICAAQPRRHAGA